MSSEEEISQDILNLQTEMLSKQPGDTVYRDKIYTSVERIVAGGLWKCQDKADGIRDCEPSHIRTRGHVCIEAATAHHSCQPIIKPGEPELSRWSSCLTMMSIEDLVDLRDTETTLPLKFFGVIRNALV